MPPASGNPYTGQLRLACQELEQAQAYESTTLRSRGQPLIE